MDKEAVGMERQAVTVWRDGRYKFWSAADAAYAQNDPDWLATIPLAQQPAAQAGLDDIEQYRLQMAAISTAAIGYWKEGDPIHPDYDTQTLRDVAKLYAKYEALSRAAPSGEAVYDTSVVKRIATQMGWTPPSAQQAEPVAWVHEDDPARVISAVQKAGALKDGGASASSVRPYSVPAYTQQAEQTHTKQLADWLLTDPQTGEPLHFAGPLERDFLGLSRVRMESKSGAVWTLTAGLREGYLTASERMQNIRDAAKAEGEQPAEDDTPAICDPRYFEDDVQPAEEARGVPVETIRAEISLILTDPDSTLSEGAVRALRYISQAAAAAPAAAEAQPDEVEWDKFPAWLIDHHEGDTITEELLQRALADMLKVHPPVAHSRQAQGGALSDEEIMRLWDASRKFLEGYGAPDILSFARAILARAASEPRAEEFNEDSERAAFEDVIRSFTDPARLHDALARDEYAHDTYVQWPTSLAWEAWKNRAALAAQKKGA